MDAGRHAIVRAAGLALVGAAMLAGLSMRNSGEPSHQAVQAGSTSIAGQAAQTSQPVEIAGVPPAPDGYIGVVDGEGRRVGYVRGSVEGGLEQPGPLPLGGGTNDVHGAEVVDANGNAIGYMLAGLGFVPSEVAQDPDALDQLYADRAAFEKDAAARLGAD